MAKQRDSKLVGTVGNIIFYNSRGQYCMRIKPGSVRRSKSSVQSGLNFGKASRIAKQIRNLIASINPCHADLRMVHQFTGALHKFISWKEKQDAETLHLAEFLPYLKKFQFNKQADLSAIRSVEVLSNVEGTEKTELRFSSFLPDKDLRAPKDTNQILLKARLIRIDITEKKAEFLSESNTEFPCNGNLFQPSTIPLPADLQRGDLAILIIALQYIVKKKNGVEMLKALPALPCGIVWAGIF